MTRIALFLPLFLAPCGLLRADWLDLEGDISLRGIDPKENGRSLSFTLEDGRTIRVERSRVSAIRKSPPGETVEFRGRQVGLREKIRILQDEEKARQAESIRALEAWAQGKEGSEAARESFGNLPPDAQDRYLAATLLGRASGKARVLAAGELGKRGKAGLAGAILHVALQDPDRKVREGCLDALRSFSAPAVGDLAIPYLASPSEDVRIRAARALSLYVSPRAVPALAGGSPFSSAGGRAFFFRGEERSYIADYDLVSGGTGYSVMEVADPVVRTAQTGVVLDVKVTGIELRARVAALRAITGRDLGPDLADWRRWWKAEGASARRDGDGGKRPETSPAPGN
jgi:hypothetical protein